MPSPVKLIDFNPFAQTSSPVQGRERARMEFLEEISSTLDSEVEALRKKVLSKPVEDDREPLLSKHIKDLIIKHFNISRNANNPIDGDFNLSAILPEGFVITDALRALWSDTVKFFKKEPHQLAFHASQPTGSGKTGYFMALAASLPKEHKIIVVVPNKTLNDQTLIEIKKACPNRTITHISSSNIKDFPRQGEKINGKKIYGDLVVVVDESFKDSVNKDEILEISPSLIIYDECHNYYVAPMGAIRNALRNHGKPLEIALSATLDYLTTVPGGKEGVHEVKVGKNILYVKDGRRGVDHFGTLMHNTPLHAAIRKGWIAPIAWFGLTLEDGARTKLEEIQFKENPETGDMDFDSGQLESVMDQEFESILRSCWSLYESTPMLQKAHFQHFAICSNVAQAKRFAEFFTEKGLPFESITGGTDENRRREIINRYNLRDHTRGLSSCNVLREGFNSKAATICWNLRPTTSMPVVVQATGRVGRKDSDYPDKLGIIVDLPLSSKRHNPFSLPLYAGLKTVQSGDIIFAPKGFKITKIQSGQALTMTLNPRIDYLGFSHLSKFFNKLVTELEIPETKKEIETILLAKENTMIAQKTLKETEQSQLTGMKQQFHKKIIDAVEADLRKEYSSYSSTKKLLERFKEEFPQSKLTASAIDHELRLLNLNLLNQGEKPKDTIRLAKNAEGYHSDLYNIVMKELKKQEQTSSGKSVRVSPSAGSKKKKRIAI